MVTTGSRYYNYIILTPLTSFISILTELVLQHIDTNFSQNIVAWKSHLQKLQHDKISIRYVTNYYKLTA